MILQVQGVQKFYDQGSRHVDVLRDVNFTVDKPEILALMGRSGSGKSTLLSILAGLDRPSAGRVEILAKSFQDMDARDANSFRFETIGIIFQQFHLLDHLTALENVRLPWDLRGSGEGTVQVRQALSEVGLAGRESHFPSQLSRGECQRVAIARTLSLRPALILADEPTGSLDAATGKEVEDLLFRLVRAQKSTLVVVTHDRELASRCDRTLHLQDGKILGALS